MSTSDESGEKPPVKGLKEAESEGKKRGLPPVHLWNPPYHGEIDMRIRRDGVWEYLGSPINRPAMVRLFSTILRLDDDGHYYLVTPVEKVRIRVDDAPFVAVAMTVEGSGRDQRLAFRTNVDDEVSVGEGHGLRMTFDRETGEPSPYVHVRAGLEALIARAVYYDLVEIAVEERDGDDAKFGVWSGGIFFPFVSAQQLGQ